jgi:hypothetical protein
MNPYNDGLYDQDDHDKPSAYDVYYGYDDPGAYEMNQYDRWRDEIAAREGDSIQRALEREQLLMWEHELNRPMAEYYDYFLEEATR